MKDLPTAGPVDGEFPPHGARNDTLRHLGSARAIRRFTDEVLDDDTVEAIVWAGTRASSPNNSQLWTFIVVRDEENKQAIADELATFTQWIDSLPPPASRSDARVRAGARGLVTGLASVPVLVFVCIEDTYPERKPDPRYLWSTAGTASQNMVVAARSLGVGATLTMLHVGNEAAIRQLLGLPPNVELGAMIALGWPATAHGPMKRRPLDEVMRFERW
jgi:nitroreductase